VKTSETTVFPVKDKRKVRKSLTAEPELDNRGTETQRKIERKKKKQEENFA